MFLLADLDLRSFRIYKSFVRRWPRSIASRLGRAISSTRSKAKRDRELEERARQIVAELRAQSSRQGARAAAATPEPPPSARRLAARVARSAMMAMTGKIRSFATLALSWTRRHSATLILVSGLSLAAGCVTPLKPYLFATPPDGSRSHRSAGRCLARTRSSRSSSIPRPAWCSRAGTILAWPSGRSMGRRPRSFVATRRR